MAILDTFLNERVLGEKYAFSESGTYHIPVNIDSCTVKDLRTFVDNLPLQENPEIVGIRDNASMSFMQTKVTKSSTSSSQCNRAKPAAREAKPRKDRAGNHRRSVEPRTG